MKYQPFRKLVSQLDTKAWDLAYKKEDEGLTLAEEGYYVDIDFGMDMIFGLCNIQYRHWCPEWNMFLVTELDKEFNACTCYPNKGANNQ